MKTFYALSILATLLIVGGLLLVFSFSSDEEPSTNSPQSQDVDHFTAQRNPQVQSAQEKPAGTPEDIRKAFLSQVPDSSSYTLKEAIIVSTYALQVWAHRDETGEALLEFNTNKGWSVKTLGGGAITADSLHIIGVPVSVAEKLESEEQRIVH